jgi:RimJ/RimL family protein N-acetyltransferase
VTTAALGQPPVTLRPTSADDLDELVALFRVPAIYERWGGRPLPADTVRTKYAGSRWLDVRCFLVLVEDRVAGFAQIHVADDGGEGGGMDLTLLPEYRRQGVGTRVVNLLAGYARGELGWQRFTVDPDVANEPAV